MAVTKVTATGFKGEGVEVNDIKVVGEQTAVIADVSTSHSSFSDSDADLLGTAINAIVASMRAHGLIDTA